MRLKYNIKIAAIYIYIYIRVCIFAKTFMHSSTLAGAMSHDRPRAASFIPSFKPISSGLYMKTKKRNKNSARAVADIFNVRHI